MKRFSKSVIQCRRKKRVWNKWSQKKYTTSRLHLDWKQKWKFWPCLMYIDKNCLMKFKNGNGICLVYVLLLCLWKLFELIDNSFCSTRIGLCMCIVFPLSFYLFRRTWRVFVFIVFILVFILIWCLICAWIYYWSFLFVEFNWLL